MAWYSVRLLGQFTYNLAFAFMWWSAWPLFIFVFWCQFRPDGGQIFGWKWGFSNFLKKLLTQCIWYLAFIYVVRLFTLIHYHVPSVDLEPLVAQYVAQIGISQWKNGKIHTKPRIYPYGKRHYSLSCSHHQFWLNVWLKKILGLKTAFGTIHLTPGI